MPLPEALPEDLVRSLCEPGAHPGDPSAAAGVTWIQTHISHVFLTPTRVLKVRKAVELSFLSFASRTARNADCLREVRLNRRLAPDVYLGVAPLWPRPGGFEVGPVGETLAEGPGGPPEHAVVMRRLPEGRDGLSLLRAGRLGRVELSAVARLLAAFHAAHGLGCPAPFTPEAWRQRVEAPMQATVVALGDVALPAHDARILVELRDCAAAQAGSRATRHEMRRAEGRAVDGHGDLHLEHIWLEEDREVPTLIDCLEFDDALRQIDTASEVAFLAMDLIYRGRADLAVGFLGDYATETDDFGLFSVVDAYASYRAAVRAKVAALAAADAGIEARQREAARDSAARHLRLARMLQEEPPPGPLVLLCGTVGTGKSTAARALAERLEGVVISSDRTRKRMAGLAATARASAPPGAGLYTAERTERVYAGVLERAAPVLASGRPALLDASFARAAQRAAALAFARALGVPAWLVRVRCDEATARARLARRAEAGGDPSDAGPGFLSTSLAAFEPPDEWPVARRLEIATDGEGWRDALAPLVRAISPAPRGW